MFNLRYIYDALGNLIYRQLTNGENQYYQYDLENQLVRAEITKPAGNTEIWIYAYDPIRMPPFQRRQIIPCLFPQRPNRHTA